MPGNFCLCWPLFKTPLKYVRALYHPISLLWVSDHSLGGALVSFNPVMGSELRSTAHLTLLGGLELTTWGALCWCGSFDLSLYLPKPWDCYEKD